MMGFIIWMRAAQTFNSLGHGCWSIAAGLFHWANPRRWVFNGCSTSSALLQHFFNTSAVQSESRACSSGQKRPGMSRQEPALASLVVGTGRRNSAQRAEPPGETILCRPRKLTSPCEDEVLNNFGRSLGEDEVWGG